MKIVVPWLAEFVALTDDVRAVAARLAACGFAAEGIEGDVIDFEVTANRPDCLSVYGFARETATAYGAPLTPYTADHIATGAPAAAAPGAQPYAPFSVKVSIGDPGCGRYAVATADVVVRPSPAWLSERLQAAGVRPINNIVDVTNYVMLEMGHPMHAFDADKLRGQEIRVRRARGGESLVTLDGQSRLLSEAMLVIADRERAIAIAGVMGGADTEVSAATTHVALESAWFAPGSVRATSRALGLKTEAAARFERGADLAAPVAALARAIALLRQIEASTTAGPIVDVQPRAVVDRQVEVRRAGVARLLGDQVPDADVRRILTGLGFGLSDTSSGWTVAVPSYRVDVTREADLIEEIGRHWGFDRIPASFPALHTPPRPAADGVLTERRVRRLLCGAGLQEAVTFTFMESAAAAPFVGDPSHLVRIANPLSEKFGVLRPSLLPGLIDALVYNRRREAAAVQLFEVGSVFRPDGEGTAAGWVLTGPRGDHWGSREAEVDFFDAKGIAQLLGQAFGAPIEAVADDQRPGFVRGRAARLVVTRDGISTDAGEAGEVRPAIVAARGLPPSGAVVAGWIDLAVLQRTAPPAGAAIAPLPRQPAIVRDLSILVDERLPAAEVRGTIRAHAPGTLAGAWEFDRYQGQGVPSGRVSLSMRLTFRDPARTLTDAEVQRAIDTIVAALVRQHGAVLRG